MMRIRTVLRKMKWMMIKWMMMMLTRTRRKMLMVLRMNRLRRVMIRMIILRKMGCRMMMLRKMRWMMVMLRTLMSRRGKMMMLRVMMLRRRMLGRTTNPKTGTHTFCGPFAFHKSNFVQEFTSTMPRAKAAAHRACSVDIYLDLSQEPFYAEVYRNDARAQMEHPD